MAGTLNVAMVGYAFMGRAHSNAWRQVGRFFDLPRQPVMQVICGRSEGGVRAAAEKLGWNNHIMGLVGEASEDTVVVDLRKAK